MPCGKGYGKKSSSKSMKMKIMKAKKTTKKKK